MKYDFNLLEKKAKYYLSISQPHNALAIYLFMTDGDPSLDAGYLGMRIGDCYERLNDQFSAKYWYGRAVEENPQIPKYVEARARLSSVSIDALLND